MAQRTKLPRHHAPYRALLHPLLRGFSALEAAQVRRFGRSALAAAFGVDVLVLHTTGRRSGIERDTVLSYVDDDGSLLVVGGAGGQQQLPDWVHNARAEPGVAVTVDRRRFDARAVEFLGEERARVWPELVRVWPRIERYERRAGRLVPVFRLIPTGST